VLCSPSAQKQVQNLVSRCSWILLHTNPAGLYCFPMASTVLVYTSPSCSACRTVKEFLSRNHIYYEERSLEQDEWLEELAEKHGAASAPAVVVDGLLVEGSLPEIALAVGVDW